MMLQRFFLATFIFSGIVSAVPQSAQAQCSQCSDQACCNKCRPNHTRIIIWRSNIVSGGLSPVMGGVPPQGFAVSSMPAMMVAQPALAISPASFGASSAGVTSADIDAAVARRFGAASASAAPAAGNTCTDPCGSILQLQRDVKDLTTAIDKITTKLEDLDRRLPRAQP